MKIRTTGIGEGSRPYIIAEVGNNHDGDFDVAMKMVREASRAGADAVKFQKRNPKTDYTKALYNAPYINEFSRGDTYGQHREALDPFDQAMWAMLRDQAHAVDLAFIATPFGEDSAAFLNQVGVDAFKISSAGLRDIPLIDYVSQFKKPMILSTGGSTICDVTRAWVHLASEGLKDVAFLHCVSTYPNTDAQLHLRRVITLKRLLPEVEIGFSSHHAGILPLTLARVLGANLFEVHFTLNRGNKGTDHGFSMEPRGLEKLCEDIRRVDSMLGSGTFDPLPEEKRGFVYKQGRSIHIARPVHQGQVITPEDITIKAPADGPDPWLIHEVIGKVAVCDLSTADTLTMEKIR